MILLELVSGYIVLLLPVN